MNWEGETLAATEPVYWPVVGSTAAMVVGSLSGLYVATVAIFSAYSTSHNQESYWNPDAMKDRIAFNSQFGGIVYNTVRTFETVATVLYIALGLGIAGVPYWLSLKLQSYLNASASSSSALDAISYNILFDSLIMMIGSVSAAYTATNQTEDILGFFDSAMS